MEEGIAFRYLMQLARLESVTSSAYFSDAGYTLQVLVDDEVDDHLEVLVVGGSRYVCSYADYCCENSLGSEGSPLPRRNYLSFLDDCLTSLVYFYESSSLSENK